MIYFCDAAGTQVRCVPGRVYQGSSEANEVVLCAPFAAGAQVSAAFRLPNGECTAPAAMAYEGSAEAYDGEGTMLHCWRMTLPAAVTQYYGEVSVQFYRVTAGDTLATQAVRFAVERGIPPESADPAEGVYESITQSLAGVAADLANGAYASRAVYAWNSAYAYGANEIAFYPEAGGGKGAFVRSLVSENTHPPYTESGEIDAAYWEETVSFAEMIAAAEQAQASAVAAEAAEDAAAQNAASAQGAAAAAAASQGSAQTFAGQAQSAAGQAQGHAQGASESAARAGERAQDAAESAELARAYAELGIQPNTRYGALEELPAEGSTKFIYLIPNTDSDPIDSYNEYIWVPDKANYEFIGSTKIDLSDYAQKTGSYAGMNVGSAQNVTGSIGGQALSALFESDGATVKRATAAVKAEQDGEGNIIADEYAKQTGTYADMSVGYATNAGTAQNAAKATQATTATSATQASSANYAATAGKANNVKSLYLHYLELYDAQGGSGQFIYGGAVIMDNSPTEITSLFAYCSRAAFGKGKVLPIHGVYYAGGTLFPVTGFYINENSGMPYIKYIQQNGSTSFLMVYLAGTDTVIQLQ